MMVATCQLDIGMLLQSFDLAPYDGFLEPESYEQWEVIAHQAAEEKASNARLNKGVGSSSAARLPACAANDLFTLSSKLQHWTGTNLACLCPSLMLSCMNQHQAKVGIALLFACTCS